MVRRLWGMSAVLLSCATLRAQQATPLAPRGLSAARHLGTHEHLPEAIIERLRQFAPVSNATNCSPVQVAGRYSAETKELADLMGSGGFLEGNSLYLFRDGKYVYTEWNDIAPEGLVEKGHWARHRDLLTLQPDLPTRLSNDLRDSHYYLFCIQTPMPKLRVIGVDHQIEDLERAPRKALQSADDRRFELLRKSREQREVYLTNETSRLAEKALHQRVRRSAAATKTSCQERPPRAGRGFGE
jgi:hypothetical protein